MKRYAVDFAYWDLSYFVSTIKWRYASSEENLRKQLEKEFGDVVIRDIRVMK